MVRPVARGHAGGGAATLLAVGEPSVRPEARLTTAVAVTGPAPVTSAKLRAIACLRHEAPPPATMGEMRPPSTRRASTTTAVLTHFTPERGLFLKRPPRAVETSRERPTMPPMAAVSEAWYPLQQRHDPWYGAQALLSPAVSHAPAAPSVRAGGGSWAKNPIISMGCLVGVPTVRRLARTCGPPPTCWSICSTLGLGPRWLPMPGVNRRGGRRCASVSRCGTGVPAPPPCAAAHPRQAGRDHTGPGGVCRRAARGRPGALRRRREQRDAPGTARVPERRPRAAVAAP